MSQSESGRGDMSIRSESVTHCFWGENSVPVSSQHQNKSVLLLPLIVPRRTTTPPLTINDVELLLLCVSNQEETPGPTRDSLEGFHLGLGTPQDSSRRTDGKSGLPC